MTGLSITAAPPSAPLALNAARVSIDGTSNVHAYTASTTTVRIVNARVAAGVVGANFWDDIVKPGALEAFEIAIPAASLSSPKGDLDKNMHKALKVQEHADITFRLLRIEPRTGAAGALRAIGMLKIAGVEKEVALDLTTERKDSMLAVKGQLQIVRTDYGITPPKAMMGMLRTDPKVTIRFETVFAISLT